MKHFRLLPLSVLMCLGVCCVVVYPSCKPEDKCGITCQNGGVCSNKACICPDAFSGVNCETRTLLGAWSGTDYTSNPYATYPQIITVSQGNVDSTVIVTIANGRGGGRSVTGTITSMANVITYKQAIAANSGTDTIAGELRLGNDASLSHNYRYTDVKNGIVYVIQGTYNK